MRGALAAGGDLSDFDHQCCSPSLRPNQAFEPTCCEIAVAALAGFAPKTGSLLSCRVAAFLAATRLNAISLGNVKDISLEELRQMLARCNSATPGPWRSFVEARDHTSGSSFVQTGGEDIYLTGASDADQDFVAHSRQDLPRLIALVAQLKGWKL